jgi:hypothetical protein
MWTLLNKLYVKILIKFLSSNEEIPMSNDITFHRSKRQAVFVPKHQAKEANSTYCYALFTQSVLK